MSDNPYTAPQSSPEPEVITSGMPPMELASRWARLGAAMLDGIIAVLVTMLLAFFLLDYPRLISETGHGWNFSTNPGQDPPSFISELIVALVYIVIYLAINGYLLVTSGQSIGKKILGIRIVDHQTGQLLPASRVIGSRYLLVSLISQIPFAGGVFGLVDMLFIFRADKRCIHDLIARSIVINS